jgi:hypothetical protein
MYKKTSDSLQRRLSRLKLGELAKYQSDSPEEDRENLVRRFKQIQDLIKTADKNERRKLGLEQQEIQKMISAIRPKRKGGSGYAGFL